MYYIVRLSKISARPLILVLHHMFRPSSSARTGFLRRMDPLVSTLTIGENGFAADLEKSGVSSKLSEFSKPSSITIFLISPC